MKVTYDHDTVWFHAEDNFENAVLVTLCSEFLYPVVLSGGPSLQNTLQLHRESLIRLFIKPRPDHVSRPNQQGGSMDEHTGGCCGGSAKPARKSVNKKKNLKVKLVKKGVKK